MRIGLTYDLRREYLAAGFSEEETAEFDRPDTIEAIDEALTQLGHSTDRIGHARQLIARVAQGDRWDLVFNIAEGLRGCAREAQVPAILDVYDIPYTFSDPLVMALSLHKGLTKLVVAEAGLATPQHMVVQHMEDVKNVALPYPLFAKPVAEGTGKGIDPRSKVSSQRELASICSELLPRFPEGVLIETYLPGREFTVGLLGSGAAAQVLGTLEILLRKGAEEEVYSYANKENSEELVDYSLGRPEGDLAVQQAEALALAAWQALGCRDAGRVDIRCDAHGRPSFLEVNPLAGLHPFHSDLPMVATAVGMSYVTLIQRIVESAAYRVKPAAARGWPSKAVARSGA